MHFYLAANPIPYLIHRVFFKQVLRWPIPGDFVLVEVASSSSSYRDTADTVLSASVPVLFCIRSRSLLFTFSLFWAAELSASSSFLVSLSLAIRRHELFYKRTQRYVLKIYIRLCLRYKIEEFIYYLYMI